MYQAPGPAAPRRSPLKLVLAIIGGIIGLALLGCIGLVVLGAIVGDDDATPTPVAGIAPSTAPTTQATSRTPTARASAGASASARPSGSAAASASAAPVVVSGCGGATIRNPNSQVERDIDQWNRIVGSANKITAAWNTFYEAAIFDFDEAAGNAQLAALADAYLATANANLPALRAETSSGRFASMATAEIAAVEAQIAFVTPYRQAVANSDEAAWDQAVAASDALDTTNTALDAEVERQCDYWRSVD
jgi:hypothetical protein